MSIVLRDRRYRAAGAAGRITEASWPWIIQSCIGRLRYSNGFDGRGTCIYCKSIRVAFAFFFSFPVVTAVLCTPINMARTFLYLVDSREVVCHVY